MKIYFCWSCAKVRTGYFWNSKIKLEIILQITKVWFPKTLHKLNKKIFTYFVCFMLNIHLNDFLQIYLQIWRSTLCNSFEKLSINNFWYYHETCSLYSKWTSYTFSYKFGHWVILCRFHQNKLHKIVAFKFAPKFSVKEHIFFENTFSFMKIYFCWSCAKVRTGYFWNSKIKLEIILQITKVWFPKTLHKLNKKIFTYFVCFMLNIHLNDFLQIYLQIWRSTLCNSFEKLSINNLWYYHETCSLHSKWTIFSVRS